MTWAVERAIQSGIDSARNYRKDGPSPYSEQHPLFTFWWNAVVAKADCRDLSDAQIRAEVLRRVKWRGKE